MPFDTITPAHRTARPLVEDFVFHFPFLGVGMNRIGGVRASPENAERLLEDEQLVVVFPEGLKGIGKLYKQRYRLQRFGRGGFVKLALRTRAKIIPTAVVGAEEIHPMLSRVNWLAKPFGIPYLPVTPTFPWLGPAGALPLPSKWFILFGEPIDPYRLQEAESDGESRSQKLDALASDRIFINRIGEHVRATIQQMIDETLAARKSSFLG